jgi:HAD superfamily hydrolase (TIGR01450 family)
MADHPPRVTCADARGAANPVAAVDMDTLIERYAVILLDAYGVLVNSVGPLPGAKALLDRLNDLAKPYFILTNDATKPPPLAIARYRGFGLALNAAHIIASGSLLPAYFRDHGLVNCDCAVLGPAGSAEYVKQAGGRLVLPDGDFDVLIVADQTGFPFLSTVDATLSSLIRQLDRGKTVHLLLPNPDLVYPSPSGYGITSGAIALILEAALKARYPERNDLGFVPLGKPQPALFAEAARRSGTRDMVMIGDQLATDIAGAQAFGIDSALLVGGVSAVESSLERAQWRPTYLLPSLRCSQR